MKTIVIHHSSDYDGIFCREIARKFLPDAFFFGWDFGDPPIDRDHLLSFDKIYVMDLPLDKPLGLYGPPLLNTEKERQMVTQRITWIDHHKTAIDSHPKEIPGYRIDGVAACRLAWQWFNLGAHKPEAMPFPGIEGTPIPRSSLGAAVVLPPKDAFIKRGVMEPLAVRLAGEYDIWDHRDNDADVAFQFGLDSQEIIPWPQILDFGWGAGNITDTIVAEGRAAMRCYAKRDADIMRSRGFKIRFEGLDLLCLNTARCNSNTFAALDKPETGHEALCGFYWNGKVWTVSLYHAAHRKDLDLSEIAKRRGGGGHRGACGFQCNELPFMP